MAYFGKPFFCKIPLKTIFLTYAYSGFCITKGNDMSNVKTVAVVGTGVIGASWAAFFLYKGFRVNAYDPAVDAENNLRQRVQVYLQDLFELEQKKELQLEQLMLQLNFSTDLACAVKDVDFIQESGPERLALKRELYAKITAYCPADTLIASSSSGLKVTEFQQGCQHPERIILGHPFNPPHLLPLVELVGGELTSAEAVQAGYDFYLQLGKKPIILRKEIKGHIANRLQSALWREAFYLVSEGVCDAKDIDVAVSSGPGLRWAIYGPYLNMQLANQNGFKAAMHHLGPPMTSWWQDMHEYELTEPKVAELEQQMQMYVSSLGDVDLRAQRDQALVEILAMRKQLHLD